MLETFQDRLVTELRLVGASNIDEANLVLEETSPLPFLSSPTSTTCRRHLHDMP